VPFYTLYSPSRTDWEQFPDRKTCAGESILPFGTKTDRKTFFDSTAGRYLATDFAQLKDKTLRLKKTQTIYRDSQEHWSTE
jgi:hypothetical protein